MRILNKYIFFFLIFLSLSGFSNDISSARTNVKYLKETEWIARPDSKSKVSKSVHFNLIRSAVSSGLPSQLREREFRSFYDRKLRVLYIVQTRIFSNNYRAHLRLINQYIPRLFTDDHNVSFNGSDMAEHFSSASETGNDVRKSLWKHLVNSEWINQKRNLDINEKDVSDGCQIGSL
jgi:hypothetical protein